MIYTVTLNPSLDYFARSDTFRYAGTNRTRDEYIVPGGKGFNVSMMLQKLGDPTTALGYAAGFTGDELERLLTEAAVPCELIRVQEGLTRINVKIVGDEVTEFNGSGICLSEDEIRMLEKRVSALDDGDFLVLSGSIPKGAGKDIYERIAGAMKKGRLVVDTNGEALTRTLHLKPFLIKPNLDELSALCGKELQTDAEIEDGARELQAQGAQNVLVSLGGDGAMLLTAAGEVIREGCPAVPEGLTLNTVAAGDTMVAGFIHAYLQNGSSREALTYSIAAGTAAAYSRWLPEEEFIEQIQKNNA